MTGLGDEHGTLVLIVRLAQRGNATSQAAGGGRPADSPVRVCTFQMVPWFLQLWMHTLQIAIDGQVRRPPS